MSDVDLDDLFNNDNHPLHWQGHHVWVRSIEHEGFVFQSYQNGKPSEATITVKLVEDGRWSSNGLSVIYTMAEALEDLVPDIPYLIEESPL